MFERFTDSARRVVMLAQEEARELRGDPATVRVGTQHLLLGLARAHENLAAKVLAGLLGVPAEKVRDKIFEEVVRGRDPLESMSMPVTGHIPFSDGMKRALELSLREALAMGHNYIGTEHLLLALVREDGNGWDVLKRLHPGDLDDGEVIASEVRHAVTKALEGTVDKVERTPSRRRGTGRLRSGDELTITWTATIVSPDLDRPVQPEEMISRIDLRGLEVRSFGVHTDPPQRFEPLTDEEREAAGLPDPTAMGG